jgi:hypothetical protein
MIIPNVREPVPGFDKPVILPPGGDILLKAAADVSAQILQEIVRVLLNTDT